MDALITGTSTGIGYATALRLHEEGYRVWAGVRNESDKNKLLESTKFSARMCPLILDVTCQEDIDKAYQTILTSGAKINVLVNNAGIAVVGVLEFVPQQEIKKLFDVNVFGLLAVTQKFLPMLRETQGRLINISSIAGRTVTPGLSPYNASKHCVEVFSDALRIELKPFNVRVVLIEPGTIETPIWNKQLGQIAVQSPYEKICNSFNFILGRISQNGLPPEEVSEVIFHSIKTKNPCARYLVGRSAKMLALQSLLPSFIKDFLIARVFRV